VLLTADDAVLLLIDLQQRLMPVIHDRDTVVARAVRLAEAARLMDVPVIATEQNPAGLGPTVPPLSAYPQKVLAKTAFSAAGAPGLAALLLAAGGGPASPGGTPVEGATASAGGTPVEGATASAGGTPVEGATASAGGSRRQIIVVGCEAHVCVLQTVLDLLADGHRVAVAADAVGSRDPADRSAALERARQHGAEIVTSEMVLFEWLRDSQHPRFREVQKLLK
jgi:nicotinamidase-related amidase